MEFIQFGASVFPVVITEDSNRSVLVNRDGEIEGIEKRITRVAMSQLNYCKEVTKIQYNIRDNSLISFETRVVEEDFISGVTSVYSLVVNKL